MMGNPKYANGFVAVQFVLFAALFIVFITQPVTASGIPRIAGIVLILVGLGLVFSAVREYRRVNTTIPQVSPKPDYSVRRVESGLYARIRHPIYTGVIAGAWGAALAHGSLLGLSLAGVILVFFTVKSYYEESLLRQTYPQYAEYMKRTGRFLPPLRR